MGYTFFGHIHENLQVVNFEILSINVTILMFNYYYNIIWMY